MSSVRELHDKAMHFAQLALVARHEGKLEQAEDFAREALKYEEQAVTIIPEDQASEPTRSILYHSAASLAYQCKEYKVAQRLIAKGLSGYPPPQSERELKDLYEQVNFEHHLQLRGITLKEEDFQLSIQGNAVGLGMILYNEFIKRIQSVHSLIERTTQRLMHKPYQRSGRISQMYKLFTPALSVPRESSFAITYRLGVLEGQQMSLLVNAEQVIDEILTGIELINNSDEKGLKGHIKEEGYYLNFVTLTRNIAPDGDKVNSLGFTSKKRTVCLEKQHNEIQLLTEPKGDIDGELEPIRVEGVLDYAISRRKDVIGLTTEKNEKYYVLIQEGMDDLVRSFFKQWVVVSGLYDGKKYIYPSDVQVVDD